MPRPEPSWRSRFDDTVSPFGSTRLARVGPRVQGTHDVAVLRVAGVVAAVALALGGVRRGVHVVDRPPHGRHPTGEEGLPQTLGRDREVGHRAEPAERLAEHAPPVDAERAPQQLEVAHDRVRAEVRQVVGLLLRRHPGQRADRRGAPGAALVDHQHPEVPERPVEPAGTGRHPHRPRRLAAGAALQEHQERLVPAVDVRGLAGEERDGLAVGRRVVEGYVDLVLGQHEAGDVHGAGAVVGHGPDHARGGRRPRRRGCSPQRVASSSSSFS